MGRRAYVSKPSTQGQYSFFTQAVPSHNVSSEQLQFGEIIPAQTLHTSFLSGGIGVVTIAAERERYNLATHNYNILNVPTTVPLLG